MRGLQIVKNFPQKQYTLPAHVLLNASEDLLLKKITTYFFNKAYRK